MTKTISPSVSILVPAYNEQTTIANVVRSIAEVMRMHELHNYECIVIDDGSTDQTAEQVPRDLATVFRHPYNKGYGAAIKTGVLKATGEIVIILDADGQHDSRDIPRFINELSEYDVVLGERTEHSSVPHWRRPGKWILKIIMSYIVGHRLKDFNCGFRAFRREYVSSILPIMPGGFSFSSTSTMCALRQGLTVRFLPINCERRVGKSYVRLTDGVRALILIAKLGLLFSPLRVLFPFVIGLLAFGSYYMILSYTVSSSASIKGIIVLLGGLVTLCFALLLDQVSAIRRGEISSWHKTQDF